MWLCRRRLISFLGRVWRRGRGFGCRAVIFCVNTPFRYGMGVELKRGEVTLCSSPSTSWIEKVSVEYMADPRVSSIS